MDAASLRALTREELRNQSLYESDGVASKYSAPKARNRQLNVPEARFVDRYPVSGSRILVLGSGTGRLPVNLSFWASSVVAIERSERMFRAAEATYPAASFPRVTFIRASPPDTVGLNESEFDFVLFPMNGIDYSLSGETRAGLIRFMSQQTKSGGYVGIVANNLRGFLLSPRVTNHQRTLRGLWRDFEVFDNHRNVGGGRILRQTSARFIREVESASGLVFVEKLADARGLFDKVIERTKVLAEWYFPNFLFVFRQP